MRWPKGHLTWTKTTRPQRPPNMSPGRGGTRWSSCRKSPDISATDDGCRRWLVLERGLYALAGPPGGLLSAVSEGRKLCPGQLSDTGKVEVVPGGVSHTVSALRTLHHLHVEVVEPPVARGLGWTETACRAWCVSPAQDTPSPLAEAHTFDLEVHARQHRCRHLGDADRSHAKPKATSKRPPGLDSL